MKPLPDWEIRLHAFARSEVGRPFEWGETNCVALGFRAIDAMCGSSIHKAHRRHMTSEKRAQAWVARNGLDGLIEVLRGEGLVVVPPNFEREGDILLTDLPGNIGASVVLGRQRLSSTEDGGVALFDRRTLEHTVAMGVR